MGFALFFMAIRFCIIVSSAQRFTEVLQGAAGTWSRWGTVYRASRLRPILFSGFCCWLQDLFQLLKREYASFLCATEQGYSISLEFDLEKIAALPADAMEEIITKAALLKRNCFSSVFEKYFNFQEKGELGHQRAVIHYREDETMWVPVWQKTFVPRMWLFGRLIDWLIHAVSIIRKPRLIDWLIDVFPTIRSAWLIDWLIDQSHYCSLME